MVLAGRIFLRRMINWAKNSKVIELNHWVHLTAEFHSDLAYIDTVLSFGLRSAPQIFSSLADGLEWILIRKGVAVVFHYLDDFLTTGRAKTSQCESNLKK